MRAGWMIRLDVLLCQAHADGSFVIKGMEIEISTPLRPQTRFADRARGDPDMAGLFTETVGAGLWLS